VRDWGAATVDLAAEKAQWDFVRGLIASQTVTAVHDISDGGLAVALAEMAMAGAIGASIEISPSLLRPAFSSARIRRAMSSQPRRKSAAAIRDAAERAGSPAKSSAQPAGYVDLGAGTAILLDDLAQANEAWLPCYMAQSPLKRAA